MAIKDAHDLPFLELVSELPLTTIDDDHAYRSAIQILDRLFHQDTHRTPGELKYFRALAILASEYEHKKSEESANFLALDTQECFNPPLSRTECRYAIEEA
jgi:hypothetical protein